MTRRLPAMLALVAGAVFSLVALALPAGATEGGTEAAAGGFGTGQWDGLVLALVIGLILGLFVFFDNDPGGIPRAGEHH